MDFVANNTHTNVALITAPPRHDLMQSSCVNNAVNSFNRKLKKLIKEHHHASLLEIDTNRNLYTNHSLHLNGQGKERLANQIVSHVHSVLERRKGSPIILNYHQMQNETVHSPEKRSDEHENIYPESNALDPMKDHNYICGNGELETNTALPITSEEECSEEPPCEQQDPTDSNQTRATTHGETTDPTTSGRKRKQPVTRGNDFFMDSRPETTSKTPIVVSNGIKGKQCKLIVLHQNICSLKNKVTELEVLLSTELNHVDILCLTEHWQSDQNLSCINIGGFRLVRSFCRSSSKHGASGIYVKNGLVTSELDHFKNI